MQEARHRLLRAADRNAAIKVIINAQNQLSQMNHDIFEKQDHPIGSGLAQGSCKLVIGNRIKRGGMMEKA